MSAAYRTTALAFVLVAPVTMAACALNSAGAVAGKVDRRGSVCEVKVYTLGLHVRTRIDDSGANMGYSERTYIFPNDGNNTGGWYFFHVPMPKSDAVALDLKELGIGISTARPIAGVMAGYQHAELLARVPAEGSVYMEYERSSNGLATLVFCGEKTPCNGHVPASR